MLLTVTSTTAPATDLGYLLHKNPARAQSFDLSFGQAHVFYPEATETRCTAALLLDVDPVALVRGRRGPAALEQYVNDRPYAATSFLSTALAKVFGTALGGRCEARPELATAPQPLEARLTAVPCRGGPAFLHALFEPLGYAVEATRRPLDPRFPDWGASRYHDVALRGTVRLADLLSHLYVLVPVLDDKKHYWVSRDEIEKLLRRGEGWLKEHPQKEEIAARYLRHQRRFVQDALERLVDGETAEPDERAETVLEKPQRLNDVRLDAVAAALLDAGARRILDLGCGEGKLVRRLLKDKRVERVVGVDVSARALEIAARRLRLDEMPERTRARVDLLTGSLAYRDTRLAGYDAAALVEVVEHLDPPRLAAMEGAVFGGAAPGVVVVTTPNAEYNVRFESLPAGRFRHPDHRFEWTRAEFRAWAQRVAAAHGYAVRYAPIGPDDAEVGAPTQMAVFGKVAPCS